MPQATSIDPLQLRVVHRQPIKSPTRVSVRSVRPSLLDLRVVGDPWILGVEGETLVLCFSDWPLTLLSGVALDLPAFNRLLDQLRHRVPRRRGFASKSGKTAAF